MASPAISEDGPHISIRKQSPDVLMVIKLLNSGSLSTEMITLLWPVYEYLRWYIDQYPALAAQWQLVFGINLLVVVVFFENGVAGGLQTLWSRIRVGLSSREAAAGND